MGVSVNPSVIIGISIAELISVRVEGDSYEEHDARGNKTGRVISEEKTFYVTKIKGEEKTLETNGKFYIDELCDLLDVKEYPSKFNIGLFSLKYEDAELEDYILGVSVASCDAMYGEIDAVNIGAVTDVIERVKKTIKETFDVNYEPKLYLDGGCSY